MFLNRELIYLLLLINIAVFSQENKVKKDSVKNNNLDEVIVTATRTVRQLSSIPMPVTLVSQKQIKQTSSSRLSDILLEQTGITTVTDFGNIKGIQMQGLDAEYTLVLIDGVPLIGRRSGNLDLERITVNNIKQIEIVKGPSSSLYGSEAMGGVINIITEKPTKNIHKGSFQIFNRAGARDELDLNLSNLYKKDKFSFNTSVNLNSSTGFDLSPQTPFKTSYPHKNFTGNLRLTYDFSDKLKATISNRYFKENQNSPTTENTETDFNINTEITHKISDNWKFDYTFYATKFKTESSSNTNDDFFKQSFLQPEIRTQFNINKVEAFVGVGARFEEVNRTAFLKTEEFESQYAFAQADFKPTEKLNIVLGARFDNHSQYKSAFSPKISARYKFNNWFVARASVGYGFKAPDFRQLYFNFSNTTSGYVVLGIKTLHELYGNVPEVQMLDKDLNPENSIGYNIGFELKPTNKIKVSINAFRNDIKDLINTFTTEVNPTDIGLPLGVRVFSYENRSRVYTQGAEIDINYKINDNFTFSSGYQYLETADKDEEDLIKSGQVFFRRNASSSTERMTLSNYFGLANRSKHMANAKLFYKNFQHRFSANIRAIYRSKYAIYDTNNSRGIIDSYDKFVDDNVLLNLSVEKKLFSLLSFQLGIDNVLDEKGQSNATNFPNDDSVLQLGRTYFGRLTFNL